MQLQCPNCSNQIEVPDDFRSKNFFCTTCGSRIQAAGLKTAASAPPTAAGEGPTKKCPYCAETILKAARKCRYCKQDLPDGVDSEFVRDRLRMKDKKAADQGLAAASQSLPSPRFGRFRTVTKVMAGLCVLFLALGVLAIILINSSEVSSREEDGWVALAVFSFILLFIFGVVLLVCFINDLNVPSFAKRTTPDLGFKTFLGGVRFGRFDMAYACLLDGDKDGLTRSRQAIEPVKVYGGDYDFSSMEGFKQYWKGICRPGEGQSRRMVVAQVRSEKSAGDYAQVSGRVRVESYPSAVVWTVLISPLLAIILVLAMTKRQELNVTKLMRRVGDQWFVVNGELSSLEDNAWEAVAGRN